MLLRPLRQLLSLAQVAWLQPLGLPCIAPLPDQTDKDPTNKHKLMLSGFLAGCIRSNRRQRPSSAVKSETKLGGPCTDNDAYYKSTVKAANGMKTLLNMCELQLASPGSAQAHCSAASNTQSASSRLLSVSLKVFAVASEHISGTSCSCTACSRLLTT
jgi:hypothetical protein